MGMTNDNPILISGGGIGGFAAALALSREGYRVRLLEQSDTFSEVGAGIQLGPNVFRMFDRLGVTEAVNELACFPDALVMMDGLSGEQITRIPLDGDFRKRFDKPYGVIFRPDLHTVLIDACEASPLISLSVNQKVERFEETHDGVLAHTREGRSHAGAALIGADGLWSRVREQIVGDGPPNVSGHIAYRAVLPIDEVPEHLRINSAVLWAGPKTHLVHYPLRRGELFNIVAVFHSDRYEEGWDSYGDPAELTERFAGQHDSVLQLLDKIESWRMWVLCDREPVKAWGKGRVTLLGDAAHPMLQYLAQGACMATEDAVCLASRVVHHDGDFETAFESYRDARYLRTGRVQLTARLYGDIYHAAGVTAELRDIMLNGRTPDQAYQGVSWLYGGIDDDGAQIV